MSDCADFLRVLFGDDWSPRHALIWQKRPEGKGGVSHWLTSADDASEYEGLVNVYVGAGLTSKSFGASSRGSSDDRTAIPGVWLDVDITGSPTDQVGRFKQGAALNEDAALDFVRSLKPPTLLVRSGWGIQAWWLFDQLLAWAPTDADALDRAKSIVYGFWQHAQNVAGDHGFRLDPTHELARLMRLPATVNKKSDQCAPAVWLDQDDQGPRYPIDELAETAALAMPSRSGKLPPVALDQGTVPKEKLDAVLANDDEIKAIWNRSARPPKDPSPSGWCFWLARRMIGAGWSDQEVTDLLHQYRGRHGDSEKYVSWYARTIKNVRDGMHRERAEEQEQAIVEEAVGALADMGRQVAAVDPDEALGHLATIAPGLQAKELVQQGRDPKTTRYALVLADGEKVQIGSATEFMNPDRVAEAIMVVTNIVMSTVKREDWRGAMRGLMKVCRHVAAESPEDVTVEWLSGYLESAMASADDLDETIRNKQPFVRDGMVHVTVAELEQYIQRGRGVKIKREDLISRLHDLGFEAVKLNVSGPNGNRKARTSRQYWMVAVERLEAP